MRGLRVLCSLGHTTAECCFQFILWAMVIVSARKETIPLIFVFAWNILFGITLRNK